MVADNLAFSARTFPLRWLLRQVKVSATDLRPKKSQNQKTLSWT